MGIDYPSKGPSSDVARLAGESESARYAFDTRSGG